MTTPKLPEGLEPVAWQYVSEDPLDGGQLMLSEEKPNRRALWPLVRLSDAQAALQALAAEKDAEIAALREALASVKNAGAPLANIAFNLAQQSGRVLDKRECVLFDKCCKHWDAAIDSALLAEKEAK